MGCEDKKPIGIGRLDVGRSDLRAGDGARRKKATCFALMTGSLVIAAFIVLLWIWIQSRLGFEWLSLYFSAIVGALPCAGIAIYSFSGWRYEDFDDVEITISDAAWILLICPLVELCIIMFWFISPAASCGWLR